MFALATPLLTSGKAPTALEQILERGYLTLVTRSGATTYYHHGPDAEPAGFEYDLAQAFADWLGVALRVQETQRFSDLFPALNEGQGDLVAANLAVTERRKQQVQFGEAYDHTRSIVVYRRGEQRPRSEADLLNGRLAVIAGSSYNEILKDVQQRQADLKWTELADVGIESLLNAITEGELDYTLVDENLFLLNAPFFPSVRRGFVVSEETPLAWAFPMQEDDSLRLAAQEFIQQQQAEDSIARLQQRYYDHLEEYNKVETYTYLKQVRRRLPRLRQLFEAAATEMEMDWRLLAAIGYQESHWDPNAVSPTGVRGIMMLTQNTARQLGVTNRTDPHQSIFGGARYFQTMVERLPDGIQGEDRQWFALAAYNVGMGHLEDARVLAQRAGGDPNNWVDVAKALPKLSRKQFYSTTKFGYARGHTAVKYVERIRAYYEILMWMDLREHPLLTVDYPPERLEASR